jgi:hypothetical protein
VADRYAQRFAVLSRAQADERLDYAADLMESVDVQFEQRRREAEAERLEERQCVEEISNPTRS